MLAEEKKIKKIFDTSEIMSGDLVVTAEQYFKRGTVLSEDNFSIVSTCTVFDTPMAMIERRPSSGADSNSSVFQQARTLTDLAHRNFAQCYGIVETSAFHGTHAVLTENMDVGLREVAEKLPLSPPTRLDMLLQCAQAVAWAHESSDRRGPYLLRDIKMETFRADIHLGSYVVKYYDVALAAAYEPTKCQHWAGSPGYAAPEVSAHHPLVNRQSKHPVSLKSDVFSFALLATELLSGGQNLVARDFDELIREYFIKNSSPRVPASVMIQYPEIVPTLEKCLAYDPAQRPAMDRVIKVIERVQSLHAQTCPFLEQLLSNRGLVGQVMVPTRSLNKCIVEAATSETDAHRLTKDEAKRCVHSMELMLSTNNSYSLEDVRRLFFRLGTAQRLNSWGLFLSELFILTTTFNCPFQFERRRTAILLNYVPMGGYILRYNRKRECGLRLIVNTTQPTPAEISIDVTADGHFVAERIPAKHWKLTSCIWHVLAHHRVAPAKVDWDVMK